MAVVAGIEPDQFGAPTPCTDMTVRQLVDHVGMALGRVDAAGRGVPLAQWPTDGFSVGDDVTSGINALVAAATTAWDEDRLVDDIELPWATLSGADALATYINEMLVHTWDLATATGQTVEFDSEAVEVADVVIHEQLPDAVRGPMWATLRDQMPEGIPFVAPFADVVPVADEASPIDRLVAWNGRQP